MNIIRKNKPTSKSIFFIHGNSSSSRVFEPIFKSDVLPYELFSFDLPGHGLSEKEDNYNIKLFKENILKLVNLIKGKEIILVGNSLGGHLALEVAEQIENLKGLVIFGTPPLPKPLNIEDVFLPNPFISTLFTEEFDSTELDQLLDSLIFNQFVKNLVKEDFLQTDPKVRSSLGQELASPYALINQKDVFLNLDIHKLIVHGLHDGAINLEFLKSVINEAGEKASLITIKDCGHYPTLEQPNVFIKHLQDFCALAFDD